MRRLWPFVIIMLHAGVAAALGPASVEVELGPIKGAASERKTVTIDLGARAKTDVFDVQDGREHHVRGVPLRELLARVKAPRAADTAIFVYADGMEIPVRLRDRAEVDAIFIALEHGNAMDEFSRTYPLHNRFDVTCPKVVNTRAAQGNYSIWYYPTELRAIRLVTWKAYESILAGPTRALPDRSGWPLYLAHCQSCHGLGGQGAKRGPDFLGNMDAYRRVPPLAVTDRSQHPSLHEKIKGFTDGTMPVLNHISNADVAKLWRWLHAVHATATK